MERIIGGRKFQFIIPTMETQEKLDVYYKIPFWHRGKNNRARYMWKKFCNLAFQKNFTWKWLHLFPKELRYENVPVEQFGGLQVDFFGYVKEKLTEAGKLMNSLQDLGQNSTV